MKFKTLIFFILFSQIIISQTNKINKINNLILFDQLNIVNLLMIQTSETSSLLTEQEVYYSFESKKLNSPSLIKYNCTDSVGNLIYISKYSTKDYPTEKIITSYYKFENPQTDFLSTSELDTIRDNLYEFHGESKYNKFKLNSLNQIERIRNYTFDGRVFDEKIFEYDAKGRIIKTIWKRKCNFESGNCEDQIVSFFKYDEKNNLIKTYKFGNYTVDEKLIQNNFIFYNDKNQVTKIVGTVIYMGDEGYNYQVLNGKLKGEFKFHERDVLAQFKYTYTNERIEIEKLNSNTQFNIYKLAERTKFLEFCENSQQKN